ncbi:hypothetical protein QC760_004580 [Botrytis cinerea]
MTDVSARQVDMDNSADTPMADGMNSTQGGTPRVTINEPEEGSIDEGEVGDKMDTT